MSPIFTFMSVLVLKKRNGSPRCHREMWAFSDRLELTSGLKIFLITAKRAEPDG